MARRPLHLPDALAAVPELAALAPDMEHLDRRRAVTTGGLRQVAAAMLAYRPLWLRAGMGLRNAVAGSLGIGLGELKLQGDVTPENLPVTSGEQAGPFTVQAFREDALWLGLAEDDNLQAYNALVMEPPKDNGRKIVHAVTLCRFKTPAGKRYLKAILPLHSLVIDRALWHG